MNARHEKGIGSEEREGVRRREGDRPRGREFETIIWVLKQTLKCLQSPLRIRGLKGVEQGRRGETRREEVAEDNMLMPRRRLHGNLRGSMCSTRFVRRIRYYNVFYTSSRRLDPRKLVERARRGWIKLNFRIYVILIEPWFATWRSFELIILRSFKKRKEKKRKENKNLYEKWRIREFYSPLGRISNHTHRFR